MLTKICETLDCGIEFCDGFDERFDSFWNGLRAKNQNKLLAVRSRHAFEWHFQFALREQRLWIATDGDASVVAN